MIEAPLNVGGHLVDAHDISRISKYEGGQRTEVRYIENGIMNSILVMSNYESVIAEYYRVMGFKTPDKKLA